MARDINTFASSSSGSDDMNINSPAAFDRQRGGGAASPPSSSGSCSSSSDINNNNAATMAGPLHLRRTRTRRRGSLLLATTAAAVSSAVFDAASVAAYSSTAVPTSSRPTAASAVVAAAAPKPSARDLLETALSLRENRRRRSAAANGAGGPDLDLLHSQIFGSSASSSSGGIPTSSSWTEALFDEPESLSVDVDVVGSTARQMESRIREEKTDLAKLRASVSSEVDDVATRLQEEAAERRRRRMAMGDAAAAAGAANIETVSTETATGEVKGKAKAKLVQGTPAFVVDSNNRNTKRNTSVNKKKKATTKAKSVASPSTVNAASKPANSNKPAPSRTNRKKPKQKQQQQQPLSPITERHERITAEEELELARTIQQGSELHNLKSTFEAQHGRDITRQEWTDLAIHHSNLGLPISNPRDLRRLVSNYRSAKNRLVASNMGLVYAVVRSKHGRRLRMAGIGEDELVQEGSLGLLRAAELFDPERGLRFSTYATVWIKGRLSNCQLDQTIALPAREKTQWNKIRRAAADLALEHEADGDGNGSGNRVHPAKPKVGDVAARTGLDAAAVERTAAKMAQVSQVLSLDYQYRTARRSDVENHSGFEHDRAFQVDADLAERLNFKSDVIAALARNLSEEEAQLLRLRYGLDADGHGEGRSLAECAKIMGWSRDKARLLANKCLKKLREADEAEALQEYLLTVA